jgi:hypothetical protein
MQKSQEQVFQIVYSGLIFVGVILSILSLFAGGNSTANIFISSYTFIITGVTLLVGFLIHKIINRSDLTLFQSFFILLSTTGPFILLLGVLGFTLYLIINFMNQINSGNVASSYKLFSKLSLVLILIQLYITYRGMQTPGFKDNGSISKIYSSFAYLVGVVNLAIVLTSWSILNYFSTDG